MEGGVGGKRRLRRVRGGCILDGDGDGDGDARLCVCGEYEGGEDSSCELKEKDAFCRSKTCVEFYVDRMNQQIRKKERECRKERQRKRGYSL